MTKKERQVCTNCGKERVIYKRDVCRSCYRKKYWRLVECERCKELKPRHAKGLCSGCYNSHFYIDVIKDANIEKKHHIKADLYRLITKECVICKWGILNELHHVDGNHKNLEVTNLVGLCSNHHAMVRDRRYRKVINDKLKELGYNIPYNPKDEYGSKG